jgi:hypothetical protein
MIITAYLGIHFGGNFEKSFSKGYIILHGIDELSS